MATIHKKTWKDLFEKIITGKKKFDVRIADFEINEGDTLVLEEWDNEKQEYTGRKVKTTATYIIKTKDLPFWTEEEIKKYGYQVIQFDIKEK